MRVISPSLLISVTLGWACGTAAAEWPSGSYGAITNFHAEVRREEGPGLLPADRLYITASTNKYALLVPAGFKLLARTDRTVTLSGDGAETQISVRITGFLPEGAQLSEDTYSARLLEEYPGAKIIKAFSASADSRTGPAFEVGLSGSTSSWQRGVVAFVPSRTCVLEFSLICNPEQFEAARRHLSTVMLTFRASDAKGELHIAPLSDRI